MFRFNFGGDELNESIRDETSNAIALDGAKIAEEVIPTSNPSHLPQETIQLSDGFHLIKIVKSSEEVSKSLSNQTVAVSDLVPGEYEGGFKLWEGGIDLADYVRRRYPAEACNGARVLELGCGHGFPGVAALLAGASVHFSDYNKEVLLELTYPTVVANWHASSKNGRELGTPGAPSVRYFGGDWEGLALLLKKLDLEGCYDFILTAETIYSVEGTMKLIRCIKTAMKKGSGLCLLASKVYYFGVGGGIESLMRLLDRDEDLTGEIVATFDDGRSNRRQILEIRWRAAES